MKLHSLAIAFCGIAILSASCTKNDPGTAEYTYTFQNTTNKRLHVDVYKSADDYNNKKNVYVQGTAEAGSNYQVSSNTLHTNSKYYIDWYSDDYTYSNWVNRTDLYEIFDPTIIPTSLSNVKQLKTEQDYARILLLGGGGTHTNWQVVDGYTFLYNGGGVADTNYWSQLPPGRKDFSLTFHRDYSVTYSFTNAIGQFDTVTIFCRTQPAGVPNGSTSATIYLYDNASIFDTNGQLNTAGKIMYNFSAPVGDPASHIENTIQVDIDGVGSFTMIRKDGL